MAILNLTDLANPDTQVVMRVTPRASDNRIVLRDGQIRAMVTDVPEGGKANAAEKKMLFAAMGLPKTRLRLLRGQTAREKIFVVV